MYVRVTRKPIHRQKEHSVSALLRHMSIVSCQIEPKEEKEKRKEFEGKHTDTHEHTLARILAGTLPKLFDGVKV